MSIVTIVTATRITVQGVYVKTLANGQVAVRLGDKVYVGKPV